MGHFQTSLPLPPFLQLGHYAFEFFVRTWALGDNFGSVYIVVCLSVTLFIFALLKALQSVLEDPRALERALKRALQRFKFRKLKLF